MKERISFAGVTVPSGEKVSQYVTVPGTDYQFPVTIVNGREDGKTLVASAGIHGCEYVGILAAAELAQELDPAELSGAVVLIHVSNLSGFLARQTYVVPADPQRKNLNKIFPGDPEGTLADKLCAFLMDEFAAKSDFLVDMHSGDMVERLGAFVNACSPKGSECNLAAVEVAKCLSFPYRLDSTGKREYYNSAANDRGIPSILFERGGAGEWTREQVDANKADLRTVMRCLHILPGEARANPQQVYLARHEWTESDVSGMIFNCVKLGDDVKKGQKLFEVRDLFGNPVKEFHAKFDGHVLIITNTLAVNVGDDLITYGTPEEL